MALALFGHPIVASCAGFPIAAIGADTRPNPIMPIPTTMNNRLPKILLLTLLMLLLGVQTHAKERRFTLASPDGRLTTHITVGSEQLTYDLVCDGQPLLLPSPVDLSYTQGDREQRRLTLRKSTRQTVDRTVASPFTRQATMRDHYNELTLTFKEGISVVFRAYDEGVAYRFRWDGAPGRVLNETVVYRFADDWTATVPYVTNFDAARPEAVSPFGSNSTVDAQQYNSSFENLYTTKPLSQLDNRRLCFLPLLVRTASDSSSAHPVPKVCITESSLLDYPGLYLHTTAEGNVLQGSHAPVPRRVEQGGHNNLQLLVREREDYIALMDREKHFPWRIAMVAEDDAALAMNNLSYLLGEPSRVDDISWIRPGKVAWEWWNCWNIGNVMQPDGTHAAPVDFEAGINNDTYKHYIDFAARYGIEYVILDEGWAVNMQADLLQVVPEIDLPMLVDYGRQRGVGLILWAGYYAFDRDMERVCRHYSQMGVKGFKIDFMDRDDQVVTDFYRRAAAMCAQYHLLVDFHGAFKPAGMTRTYPNVLNFEGVAGLEQLKWAPATWNQVQYDVELPFIRQTAGPMDYTQGAMHNAARGCYAPLWSEPMSQGTRCHQLALYIVLESPLNMLCDSPTNYESEPYYTRFVAAIPTVWDETRVLQGRVGEYIVTARRKGNVWYLGGITNWTARDIDIDLSQLGQPSGDIELFADGANAHRKGTDYRHSTLPVTTRTLTVHMAPGGGFTARFEM